MSFEPIGLPNSLAQPAVAGERDIERVAGLRQRAFGTVAIRGAVLREGELTVTARDSGTFLRCEPIGEGDSVGQIDVLAKELELAVTMIVLELFEEASSE